MIHLLAYSNHNMSIQFKYTTFNVACLINTQLLMFAYLSIIWEPMVRNKRNFVLGCMRMCLWEIINFIDSKEKKICIHI